jgi:hypothetical protein
MISPNRLADRAAFIMDQCGGVPDRTILTNPSPAFEVSWDAYHVGWHLMFARYHLDFLRVRGSRSVSGLRWAYMAYAKNREKVRIHVRLAGEFLAKAEDGYTALQLGARPALMMERVGSNE